MYNIDPETKTGLIVILLVVIIIAVSFFILLFFNLGFPEAVTDSMVVTGKITRVT